MGLSEGVLTFGLGPVAPQPALAHRLEDTSDGDLIEFCPAAAPIIATLSTRLQDHGGAGIVIDYGDWRSRGDTFQAVRRHGYSDPMAAPGEADLTAHVDFEALAQAAVSATTPMVPQGVFLERLGITARAQSLAAKLSGSKRETLIAAHRRLTHPKEMGTLFKVIGFYPATAQPPPGFDNEP